MRFSDEYVQHLTEGAFAGRVDPWAEAGRYFHQIHSGMIGLMLATWQPILLSMGYVAGREASLQIADKREPDVYIKRSSAQETTLVWDYTAAAEAIQMEVGVLVETDEALLDALYIRGENPDELVTIVEIVSPRNKISPAEISVYEGRRHFLVHTQGVNVVEIDLTRSVKRLLSATPLGLYPYHIAIHLPNTSARFIGLDLEAPLKSFALPLRGEVIPVETHTFYQTAYQQAGIAAQIQHEGRYTRDDLPFPSLLTSIQRETLFTTIKLWLEKLQTLRGE